MRIIIFIYFLFLISCKTEQKEDVLSKDIQQKEVSNHEVIDSIETLEVYDFNGLEKFLNKKDDKIYVVNFWATWCGPCIKELPYFERINKNYQKKDVEVILVSLDFPSKYDTHLKPYIENNNLKSKVIALNDTDSNSWIPKVDQDWSGAIPATIIYNKNKRKFYEQSFEYKNLEEEVKQFLN